MADQTSTSKYIVDTQSAIDNVNRLSKAYIENNQALGGMVGQFGTAKSQGKDLYSSFTQITTAGQKVTTTVKEINGEFSVMAVKVAAATLANKRLAEQQVAIARATEAVQPLSVTSANQGQLSTRFNQPTGPRLEGAVQQANQLTIALAKGNAVLGLFNNTSEKVQIAPNLNAAKVSLAGLNKGFQDFGKTLDQISKIALATVIYRGLSLIQQGITQSISSAADYYKQLALVQTLAGKNAESFNTWAGAIEKVSNELGQPVVSVTKAAYDGLSNQVVKSTKDFDLLRQSFILAKTTGSDAGNSLNLISSIINGFQKSAAEAEDIANKLFTTVDLGNVNLQELKDTIGRSASLSKTLGVSFEELAAGIAVITQTGVGAAESTTLLNNIFVQLLKPNENLSAALLELNFKTGEAAIAALGFAGVLEQLGKKATGTADGLATFFPEIRGLRGVAALTGAELVKFEKTLDAITNSSGRAANALKIVQENAGQKFADELERVKNFFTADIGSGFLTGLIRITDQFGGISKIVKETTIAIGLGTAAIAAFVVTSKSIALAETLLAATRGMISLTQTTAGLNVLFVQLRISATAFVTSFSGFLAISAASYIAVDSLYNLLVNRSRDASQKVIDDANRAADARTKAESQATQRTIKEFDRALSDRNKLFGSYLREQVKLSTKALDTLKEKTQEVNESLRNSFDISLGLARQSITNTEQEEAKATGAIRKIKEEQLKGIDEAEKDQFEGSIDRSRRAHDIAIAQNRNEIQSNNALAENLSKIVTARNAQLTAKRDEAIGQNDIEASARFQREILGNLKLLQEESVQVRGISQYLFDQSSVSQILNATAADYNNKLQSRIPLLKQEASAANSSALEQKKRVKDAEDLFKKISKFNSDVVKDGSFNVKFAADPTKAIDGLKKLQDEALKFLTTSKGIKDEGLLKDLGTNLQDVVKDFNDQQRNLAQIINETQRSLALSAAGRNRAQLLEEEKKLVRELGAELDGYTAIINKNAAAAAAGAKLISDSISKIPDDSFTNPKGQQARSLLPELNKATELLQNPKQNLKEIEALVTKVRGEIGEFGGELQTINPFDANKTQSVKESLTQVSELLANIKNLSTENSSARFNQILLESAKSGKADLEAEVALFGQLKTLKEGLSTVDPVLPRVDEAIAKVQALIQSLQQVKAAEQGINNFAPTVGGGKVEEHAKGGVVGSQGGFLLDFLSGRFKKGTDTIPAMLTRGERVITAPMAEKYATMLDAINSNRLPLYRAEGSPNTGSSVGSINVNMPRGTTQSQVREFAKQVSRGIKQGTIKL